MPHSTSSAKNASSLNYNTKIWGSLMILGKPQCLCIPLPSALLWAKVQGDDFLLELDFALWTGWEVLPH